MAAWHKPSRDRLRPGRQRLANQFTKSLLVRLLNVIIRLRRKCQHQRSYSFRVLGVLAMMVENEAAVLS
jgi:hypothetical protein